MSKCLVTGGAGFIGSHLVDKLLTQGHEVVVIDDLSGGYEEHLSIPFWEADCRDEKEMNRIFAIEKPEVVYHLACNAAENKAQFSPIDITSRNYDAFIKVLTAFINNGGKKFVFTSSIAVYGALQTPFKETDKPEPEDLYGITKLAAEQTLKVMSRVHDFEYVIARPHNVYGPRQNMSDPYRNVVTIWMNAILKGEPYYIYGDGKQRRQFSYIDEVIDQLVHLPANSVNNVGSNIVYSLNDLCASIQQVTGTKLKPVLLPERPQEVKEAIAINSQEVSSHTLEDCLRNTWEWVKSQGPKELKYTGFEIDSPKIPQNWRKS